MFSDKWDDEIQSNSPVESKTQKQINRSLTHACLVLFSSFHAIGVELKCGVCSHWVIAKKTSERVRCNTSNQLVGFCYDKTPEAAVQTTKDSQR